ncbi:MAG: hypothetical protein GY701_22055 [Sulfitobacter sp.]|nr:hypothetical protein [Sulfitobacter sp.]
MAVYRKKPGEKVEAVRWLGNNEAEMGRFLGWPAQVDVDGGDFLASLFIPTPGGPVEVKPGDWVVESFLGGFHRCKPDIFDATYEEVEI